MGSIIFSYALVFLLGLCIGMIIRDRAADDLYYSATERGDYWFDKYMRLVDPQWEPLSSRYRSEYPDDFSPTQEDDLEDTNDGHATQTR